MNTNNESSVDLQGIAIIGMAGRFPGARSITEYWENLCAGKESITFFSDEELRQAQIPEEMINDPDYVKASPILTDIDLFDAGFFNYSPREASALDPQQRLLLECAWETLEDGGYSPDKFQGDIGMFAGSGGVVTTYLLRYLDEYPEVRGMSGSIQHLGNDKDFISTRVSYKLDLKGPSLGVQTACSTSLVTVHLACQSLLNGECDMALAGGVNIRIPHISGYLRQEGDIFSADGHCRAFDANATGILFGSGVGLVLLKPLENAIRDGDSIFAVIKGSAINNDGGKKMSYTASSSTGQVRCISEALSVADVDPETIFYIETHGTGTTMGDPVEVSALTKVFRRRTEKKGFCGIGSVKSNVGHLEAVAGIASLIKTALAIRHKKIPPSINIETLNPKIDFDNSPFYVNTMLRDWPTTKVPLRAGVNSLGIGGTNAFLILEEPPKITEKSKKAPTHEFKRHKHLLTLSAKTEKTLDALIKKYCHYLETASDEDIGDICFTANAGRSDFSHRISIIAASCEEMCAKLSRAGKGSFAEGVERGHVSEVEETKVAFYFPHIMDDFPKISHRLLQLEPRVKGNLEKLEKLFGPYLQESLMKIVSEGSDKHPLIAGFALQYTLANLWMTYGIRPAVYIGNGVGELVAACMGEMISLEDAVSWITNLEKFHHRTISLADFQKITSSISIYSPKLEIISAQKKEKFNPTTLSNPDYWFGIKQEENISKIIAAHECGIVLVMGTQLNATPALTLQKAGIISALNEAMNDWDQILRVLGTCYIHGIAVDWEGVDKFYSRRRVKLPTYPFERSRYWVDPNPNKPNLSLFSIQKTRWGGERIRSSLFKEIVYQSPFSISNFPFLGDHRFSEMPMVAASALISMILSIAEECIGAKSYAINGATFSQALVIPEDKDISVQLILTPESNGEYSFKVLSLLESEEEEEWTTHFIGRLKASNQDGSAPRCIEDIRSLCKDELKKDLFYQLAQKRALKMGSSYRWIKTIWKGEKEALCQISPELMETNTNLFALNFHPGMIDAFFQLLQSLISPDVPEDQIYLLIGWDSFHFYKHFTDKCWCHAELHPATSAQTIIGDVALLDGQGNKIAEVKGVQLKSSNKDVISSLEDSRFNRWKYEISWKKESLNSATSLSLKNSRWLIFADGRGLGDAIVRKIEERGGRCECIYSPRFEGDTKNRAKIKDPTSSLEFQELTSKILDGSKDFRGIIYLWGLDSTPPAFTTGNTLKEDQKLLCGGLLNAVKSFGHVTAPLWVITRGGISMGGESARLSVSQATLWGMGRTIGMERPHSKCAIVDLDPDFNTISEIEILLQEIASSNLDNQMLYRGIDRYVAKLVPFSAKRGFNQIQIDRKKSFQISVAEKGNIESLKSFGRERKLPGRDEVEVEIQATALNYRDVLCCQGLMSDESVPLGDDCSGVIVTIGDNVQHLNVGDKVMVLSPGCLASHIVVSKDLVCPVPKGLTMEESASVPLVFSVGYYALHKLANIKKGDRVLIHSAAGGIGLAAIQLAKIVGAELYCTVDSPEKLSYLRSSGIEHVFNSRTVDLSTRRQEGESVRHPVSDTSPSSSAALEINLEHTPAFRPGSREVDFYDEIKKVIGDERIDIVLNSLTGELASKSYALLHQSGCFLDLTKGASSLSKDITSSKQYHSIDFYDVIKEDPKGIQSIFHELLKLFEKGTLKTLPVKTFSLENSISAVHYLSQIGHIGKVVISHDEKSHTRLRSDSTYIIFGAFGALGPYVLDWLVDNEVKYVFLADLSDPPSHIREKIDCYKKKGIQIGMGKVDVTNFNELKHILQEVKDTMPEIRCIFASAAVIDDDPFVKQEWTRFAKVMACKVEGSWNLHLLTQHLPLDHFIMFSSIASLMGSPNQTNYSAANAFQDALAHYRRLQGMPALSINWSPWSVGIGAAMGERAAKVWKSWGSNTLKPDRDIKILSQLINSNAVQLGVLPINWAKFTGQYEQVPSFLSELASKSEVVSKRDAGGKSALQTELQNAAFVNRKKILDTYLLKQISSTLGISGQENIRETSFMNLGLDSLMAVDLRNTIQQDVGQELPAMVIFAYPTIAALSDYLETKMEDLFKPQGDEKGSLSENQKVSQNADDVSDEDLGKFLDNELKGI